MAGDWADVQAVDEGQVLYNGIRIPSRWPPDNVLAGKGIPLPVPYYLRSPPAVIPIDVGRQLFVDDFLIAKTTLTRTFHYPKEDPANPLLGGFPFSGGVWYDPQDKIYKMWRLGHTTYHTSPDGIHWSPLRKVLKLNSLTLWLDTETKDPARRYVNYILDDPSGKNHWHSEIWFSPDGINFTKSRESPGWSKGEGDRSSMFYNPFRKKWVLSLRSYGSVRYRNYWEMNDLAKDPFWPGAKPPGWVGADSLDVSGLKNVACQLYNLDCTPYESLMLGFFSIWRGDPYPGRPGKVNEVCMGYSRDGWSWTRPDRKPVCPVCPEAEIAKGKWNAHNVQSCGGGCLIVGDELYIYSSGRATKGVYTGLWRMRRDGWASMDGTGELTTRPVKFAGKRLFSNVAASEGELTAEVLDEKGAPVAPFTAANCTPVKADATRAEVKWKGAADLSALAGKSVAFRFQLKKGSFYAFWVSPDASGASYGYVAAGGPGFTSNRDTVGAAADEAVKTAKAEAKPKGK
jgi:hypothetical protein